MSGQPTGLRRMIALFRAFRTERSDPDGFYRFQAADTMVQLQRDIELKGARVLDIGGGAGYFSTAMATLGAQVILIEPEASTSMDPALEAAAAGGDEDARHDLCVWPGRLLPGRTVAGDGNRLPFADDCFDAAFSSNVLEHVPDPARFIDEAIRVVRPGGHVYISFTAWFSPWGGHETSPWHYLGGERAAQRYERQHGRPPGNRYGRSLFRCDVGTVMRLTAHRADALRLRAEPRYYPSWMRFIVHLPLLRELLTWNLAVTLEAR